MRTGELCPRARRPPFFLDGVGHRCADRLSRLLGRNFRPFLRAVTTGLLNSFVTNENLTKHENKCVNPGRIGLSRLLSLENPTQRPDNQPTVSVNTYLVTALC